MAETCSSRAEIKMKEACCAGGVISVLQGNCTLIV